MKKRYLLTSLLSLFISSVAFAQSNIAVDYFSAGELKVAKDIFEKQVGQSPAEANYYLGEIAYAEGDFSKAKAYYEAGLASSADYSLNNVGLGKILLKTDPKAAEQEFSTALKKNKKDVEVLVAIARAYHVNGQAAKAESKIADARKADKKSPLIYIYEGDVQRDAKDVGKAAAGYAQAINFDPNCAVAYIKSAQIYEEAGSPNAVTDLQKVLELRPDYILAHKYLGKIHSQAGQYDQAIESYKTYFAKGEYSVDDLTRYAAALYFTKQYDESKKLIEEGIGKDPNNFVLNRLLMYNYVDSKDYTNGLATAEKFFALEKGKSEYLAQDYMSYGAVLSQNDQFAKGVEQYEKAIKLDPKKFSVYKEISDICVASGQNLEAAEFLKKYIELAGEEVQTTDYFNLGRYYYMAGNNALKNKDNAEEVAKGKELLKNAEQAFGQVTERISDSYLGYLWRARANAALDPETEAGLAKPYYEKTAEILLSKDDNSNTNDVLEAYRYLSYYHYLQYFKANNATDKALIKSYSEKMLELDPQNAVATQLLDAIK